MKIIRLILNNFANISTGMKLKKLDLDLTKSINRIILLIGKNGSGKTSILSNLHPFAYPGTMDIRNGSDIILPKVDGYKEVHILDDGILYIVKHFYNRSKDSVNVKSFVTKNGVELNPNGNVTSFKELMEMELGLEQDFLKLLRLGSNVTSFIGMKSTERKKFTSALLADVDIYSGYYKKINDDSRVLKTMIRTSSEKLRRLNIDDEDIVTKSLLKMTHTLSALSDKRDSLSMNIGKLKGSMESLYDGSLKELKSEISNLQLEAKRVLKEKESLEKSLDKLNLVFIDDPLSYRKELDDRLSQLEKREAIIVSELTLYINELESLYTQKETKENNLKYIDSEVHIGNLEGLMIDINEEILELKRELGFFDASNAISKEQSLTILNTLKDIRYIILDILALDQRGEIKAFYSYAKGNVKSIVRKKMDIIDKSMLAINMQLNREINEYGKGELLVLYRMCEHEDCPYVRYYNETSGEVVTKRDELKTKLSKLDTERTYYGNISNIDELMTTIGYILKHNSDLFAKSPFRIGHELISQCLLDKTNDPITDMIEKVSDYIAKVECFMEIKEKEATLDGIEKEIEMLKRNSKSLDIIKDDINNILNRISEVSSLIGSRKETKENIINEKDNILDELDILDRYMNLRHQISEKSEEIKNISSAIVSMEGIVSSLVSLDEEHSRLSDSFNDISLEMEQVQKEIDDVRMRLKEYRYLSSELKLLDEKYEDISILKESLSSSTGIPLLFIQLYLRSTRKIVNELLNIVYKGNLEIETFIVNDKEFKIPYTKDGVTVEDVIYASQGEMSFISLVMSLGLIKQSIKKYNILLLDEVDSTLDQESRQLFLSILEIYLDEIGCEQVFMITHNNAFDNYDVDMIITTPSYSIDNFTKVNVVYQR